MANDTISLGTYLFERIHEVGVKSIFGVPGDFNLALLDKIDEVKDLSWKGNANELNGAYAADGYSRVMSTEGKGLSCLITTFGVGELSALNGVAGAYAEHVGLVHVVGVPATSSQQKQLLLHHTLGNGDFTAFVRMSKVISHSTGVLTSGEGAVEQIDKVIRDAFINQRPTYLAFPANLVEYRVPKSLLKTPLDLSIPKNPVEVENEVIERVLELISKASDPVILIDACCSRHDATAEASKLIETTKFKFAVTPMAKGSKGINEGHERFAGVYVGSLSYPHVKEYVENSDLVISLGAMLSDFNTGSFSYSYNTKNVIEFHSDYTKIRSATYDGVRMKEVLQKILASPALPKAIAHFKPVALQKDVLVVEKPKDDVLKQQYLWQKLSGWLKEEDVIISETGTSSFGIIQTKFPKNACGISQVLWGSIGYSVGATFGAVMAAEEIDPNKRVILFVGDGSLQLTVQEISTMIRNKNRPYLFVLNNSGYTIEKLIHGPEALYNEIQPWQHLNILETFGAQDFENIRISSATELDALFADAKFAKNDKIRIIEIMLDTFDAPENLIKQAELSAATNAKD